MTPAPSCLGPGSVRTAPATGGGPGGPSAALGLGGAAVPAAPEAEAA